MGDSEKVRPSTTGNEVGSEPVGEEGASKLEKVPDLDFSAKTKASLYNKLLRKLLCWEVQ